MNSWLILVILTSVSIIVISPSKNDNRILSTSSSYPRYLVDNVEKCKVINKFPWLTTKLSDEQKCKKLMYSNEYMWDDEFLKTNNYQYEDIDNDNTEEQQKEISKIFINDKRGIMGTGMACDCQIKNDVIDLGYPHFPRYLFTAVCQDNRISSTSKISPDKKSYGRRCWRGTHCKPVEYKVSVLTHRTAEDLNSINDPSSSLLPDVLRPDWKFKTVTVAAGCSCSL